MSGKGACVSRLPAKPGVSGKGKDFFINTNVLCSMDCEEPCLVDSHLLHKTFLGGHFKSIFETKYLDPVLKNRNLEILELRGDSERQQKLLARLREAARLQNEENTEFQTRNLFSEIWLLLLDEIAVLEYERPAVDSVHQERLQAMLAFIGQNYQRKLSLDEIAASAHVGRRECLRCFRNCMQKTPFEYLLEYRVEMSKKAVEKFQALCDGSCGTGGIFQRGLLRKNIPTPLRHDSGRVSETVKNAVKEKRQPLQTAEKCVY